jgi:hypothetical protein
MSILALSGSLMSMQFSPQLTHGGIPDLEAGLALKHLLTPVAEHIAMPGGGGSPAGLLERSAQSSCIDWSLSSTLIWAIGRSTPITNVMVSLEMLAYTSPSQVYPHPAMRAVYGDRGDFIALVANDSAEPLLPELDEAMGQHVPTKVLPVPNGGHGTQGVRLSDHSPFWDQGYDALMVTDTSLMRNPRYHQMSDTVDTLDLPFFCGVVEGLAGALG